MKIRDINEAKQMDSLLKLMTIEKKSLSDILDELGISSSKYDSLCKKIIEYNYAYSIVEDLSSADGYYRFDKIEETEQFLLDGGFEIIYLNAVSEHSNNENRESIKKEIEKKQNELLDFQLSMSDIEKRLRKLELKNQRIQWIKNSWWIILTIAIIANLLIEFIKYLINN